MRPAVKRRVLLPTAAALLAALLVPPAPGAAGDRTTATSPAGLAADLDILLADPRLTGAHASVQIADSASGHILYQRHEHALMLPASTLKVVTAASALQLLGPQHRFTTEVRTSGRRSGPVLHGDLVLRGGGDPSLLATDLDALARHLAGTGIRQVTGRLLFDDSRYDSVPLGPGWAWDDQPYYFSPQISALTIAPDEEFDLGTVKVTLTPAAPGGPVGVTVTPAAAPVQFRGRVTTGPPGSEFTAEAVRNLGTNQIGLTGSIPADYGPADEWVTVDDPAAVTATVFAAALRRYGVGVREQQRADGSASAGRVLARHDSAPLAELIVPFLKLSNNGIAEHLVKEIGRMKSGEGSWRAGLEEVSRFLRTNSLDGDRNQADGSGLSRYNLMSAQQFTALLTFARRQPWYDAWYRALPVAGDPRRMVGGTLAGRMRGTLAEGKVHAKTGSMTGVDALTGYVEDASGRLLAFTVLVNHFAGPSPRPVIDRIAIRLAGGDEPARTGAGTAPTSSSGARQWEDCLRHRC
ncbi:D-alanyl-D-alanine carboxypeptidase/D-alanyl-D-alanine-endopeptidase [Streptomyces sp. NPDC058701]|uniref:D-alanyl-D-alanine carboxypeptidase/D-alanyl-D-alanine endopeptidase n=1 Tax=Streptomyces sp. NPDC058701 TaxID=3346608 RepID=UPI00366954F3